MLSNGKLQCPHTKLEEIQGPSSNEDIFLNPKDQECSVSAQEIVPKINIGFAKSEKIFPDPTYELTKHSDPISDKEILSSPNLVQEFFRSPTNKQDTNQGPVSFNGPLVGLKILNEDPYGPGFCTGENSMGIETTIMDSDNDEKQQSILSIGTEGERGGIHNLDLNLPQRYTL